MWKRKHAGQFGLGCSPLLNKVSKNKFHRIIYRVEGFGGCEAVYRKKKKTPIVYKLIGGKKESKSIHKHH